MKNKKIILLAMLLLLVNFFQAQNIQNSPIAKVTNGTTYWLVSQSALNQYLTSQLNQNSGIEGEITSSTIVLINGVYYASGRGQHMSGDYAQHQIKFKVGCGWQPDI